MRAPVLAAVCVVLAACGGPAGVAGRLLSGGGPNVAANGQAGEANHQTVGASEAVAQSVESSAAEVIEQSTGTTGIRGQHIQHVAVSHEAPPWVWVLALVGWVLPTPQQILRDLASVFRRALLRVLPRGG